MQSRRSGIVIRSSQNADSQTQSALPESGQTASGSITAAIDLGGTNVRAAVVDDSGSILAQDRIPTPTGDADTQFLVGLVEQVCAQAELQPDRAVIGLPGVVDHVSERLIAAPNLPQRWIAELTEKTLQAKLGCVVSLANDADLAAVGEATFGSGRDHRDVVYITISTGVGAGVVVGGKLVKGTLSGGEIGHTIVDIGAAQNGMPATVEEIGSGTAIANSAAAAGLPRDGAEFVARVRSGNEQAIAIWETAIAAVGVGLANLAWIVAPEVIVVGGGVGRNHDLVAPIISAQLTRFGPERAAMIAVESAALGDDAALHGAAAWWNAVGRTG